MSYSRLFIGDANVARFWQASQLARPQLVGVPLRTAACLDTLATSLSEINDSLDYVIVSVATSLIIDEASEADVKGSCLNIFEAFIKHLTRAAKKSARVEVSLLLLTKFCRFEFQFLILNLFVFRFNSYRG